MTKIKFLVLSVCLLLSTVFIGASVSTTAFAAEQEHEHWWYITDYTLPTCTEQGYTEHHCYYCGESHKDDYIAALGHDFLEITIEPTCTARGYTTHFCTVCGFEYVDNYIDALEHNYQSEIVDATCTTDGYTLYTCSTCGHSYKDSYNYAFGHYYIADVLEPNCTEGGYTTYTCYHCGDSYIDDYTSPNGHYHDERIIEPTCVAYGYTEHICADCGDRYVTDYVRPHGHDYEKIVVKPTDSSTGYTINLCRHCNYSYLSDFVTSGDEWFEEHIHEYSLFVARYDAQERFIVQNYCACGEIDNTLLNIIFIDEGGNYTFLTPNYNGEVRYSHLYGDYNVYILNKQGEMLNSFKVRAGTIPEVHVHDYSLTVTRNDEEKNFVFEYKCGCGETDNSLLNIVFFDEDGNYITIAADNYGKIDYSALSSGDYTIFILGNRGEMLSTFKITVAEEVIPEVHVHDYLLSVTKHEDEKYFTVQYVCRCGEIQNDAFRATFIDDNGNSLTLTADENGNVNYSQLCGNYNVFVFGDNGEMLTNFKLTVVEEHIHDYKLTVTKNDTEKYFTVQYICGCGEVDPAAFHAIFIDGNGDSQTLNVDGNGKVDYSELSSDEYNVFVLDNYGEILESFTLSVAEEVIHIHDYSLTVTRCDADKYFTVQYVCGCGEVDPAIFQVLFTDKNGAYITLTADEYGAVDYATLSSGDYNVFILGSHSEMLYNFKLTIPEEVVHTHNYELSIIKYEDGKYLTVNYLCDCGETVNGNFRVNFIDENGGSTIIYADLNGKVDYSELVGGFNVFVLNNSGEILDSFKLTVLADHTHNYTLSVTRHDGEKYFVMEYLCDCGADKTDTAYAIFMDERGDYVTLTANENGEVHYSQLVGKYNIFIMDEQGKLLSNFRMTIAEEVVHNHYYTLTVTRNDGQKYFVVQYTCDCGEVENAVFRIMCVDEKGGYSTLNANANGEVHYPQLCGEYSIFILNNYGEILQNFKLSVAEEVIHNHYYTLSVARNDNEKAFALKYVCDCGEIENGTFRVVFIDENGNYLTMNVDENGKVDYSELVGNFNVFIQSENGEILSNFKLSVAEEHTHGYTLTVTNYEDERYLALQFACECGETEIPVYHAIFIDENGNSVTKNANVNGDVDYSELVGNFNVFILNNYGEILTSFDLQIAEKHIHGYSYSLTRNDNEKCFVIKYVCECGETESVILYAVFIDGNGNYTTLYPNENDRVNYSALDGRYTVLIQNGNGEILSNFALSEDVIEPPIEHTHEYSLSVTRNNEENYFVLQHICDCGEVANSLLNVIFLDENGNLIPLTADENGKVDYSHLSGDFTVYISDKDSTVLTTFELSVYEEEIPNEPPVIDDTDIPENSSLPVVLAVALVLLAAGGIAAFIFNKKRNKKSN